MESFQFNFELNLKRMAMISIAQVLWKSTDVTDKINELEDQNKLKLPLGKYRYLGSFRSVRKLSDENFDHWEKVIDCVLEKVSSLFLPSTVESELWDVIVFLGEKIFYFYDEYHQEFEDAGRVFWEHTRCMKCIEMAKTKHFYSISSFGTMVLSKCSILHFKHSPVNKYEFQNFLDDACRYSNTEIIQRYQEEIILYLQSLQPGLCFKNKTDIVFNIICVWHFMEPVNHGNYAKRWRRKYFSEYNSNGLVKIPADFLKNTDFIVPLKVVPQMCINSEPSTFRYLTTKLLEYSKDSSNIFKILRLVLNFDDSCKINKRLHHHPNPDYLPDKILFALKLMASEQRSDFLKNHLKHLLLHFLPVWPYQEVIFKILDFCANQKFDLDYTYLLDLLSVCLGNENKSRYKVQKETYLQLFKKVWSIIPEGIKLFFLVKKTIYLAVQYSYFIPILKLLFTDEDYESRGGIVKKWEELLEEENNALVKKFLHEIVLNGGRLDMELENFLNLHMIEQDDKRTLIMDDLVI